VCAPETDIYQTAEAIVVVADMPGLEGSQVSVDLENDILTIRGRSPAADDDPSPPLVRETAARDFERSFTINAEIDREKIRARMKNGVMTVELPFAAELQPRQIAVESE
jgi:HSP20 family molecular chaperone IbpA